MKVAEIIAAIDELRPNEYSASMKTKWLSECEGTIVDEVLNRAEGNEIEFEGYDYETDQEKETLLPDRFADIYLHYIRAKIELYDDETTNYNNAVAIHQASYAQYAAWYRRTHMPKKAPTIDIWGRNLEKRGEDSGGGSADK